LKDQGLQTKVAQPANAVGQNNCLKISQARFPIHAVVDYRDVIDQKHQAVACHASQGGMRITGGVLDKLRKVFGVSDQYMRAYPPPTRRRERDLFDGVILTDAASENRL